MLSVAAIVFGSGVGVGLLWRLAGWVYHDIRATGFGLLKSKAREQRRIDTTRAEWAEKAAFRTRVRWPQIDDQVRRAWDASDKFQ